MKPIVSMNKKIIIEENPNMPILPREIAQGNKNAISKYLNSNGWITENKVSKKFEIEFSKLVKSKYSIVYPNGTLTMVSILLALGIKKNDEVILPSMTFAATANVVELLGAKPVFVDIDKDTILTSYEEVIKKITKKTKYIYKKKKIKN